MTHAAITGWGKCLPPAILTNNDLATFIETSDEWIVQRTGIQERRVSHVSGIAMAHVAAARAIACAGLDPADIDLIVYGGCTNDEGVPNDASGLQVLLGAYNAACYDINTACTSFLYGLSTANALIRTGVARNAVVVGVELISRFMDWENRGVSVLFGDGAGAVVLQATDREDGLLGESLGCYGDARQTLRLRGIGGAYTNRGAVLGDTFWDFEGQDIFKRAVQGMSQASATVLDKCGVTIDEVDLVVPHQANLRIIESVAKRAGAPMDKVFLTVHKYGNMSAATVVVALVEAVESGRVQPGALVLLPAFGAGLTWCSHLVRWGARVTPLGTTDIDLPPCDKTALEMVQEIRQAKGTTGRSLDALRQPRFAEDPPEADHGLPLQD
ncbi:MAG: ketoacyl-ACP synthase III [Rubrivivax sp.]|nr:MAG: ketoacyl-ACP synthase III [Rubrivivax sp.]